MIQGLFASGLSIKNDRAAIADLRLRSTNGQTSLARDINELVAQDAEVVAKSPKPQEGSKATGYLTKDYWQVVTEFVGRLPGVGRPAEIPKTENFSTVQLSTREEYRAASRSPSPNTVYEFDGIQYITDFLGRGIISRGELRLNAGGNRFYDDRLIGHQGIKDDIAFHAGADEFGFQGGALNVSPGNKSLNIKEYRAFERTLKENLQQGSTVEAEFIRVFNPENTSTRPDKYVVKFRIDKGDWQTRSFFNRDGGGK
jgi:hypothetical protein